MRRFMIVGRIIYLDPKIWSVRPYEQVGDDNVLYERADCAHC